MESTSERDFKRKYQSQLKHLKLKGHAAQDPSTAAPTPRVASVLASSTASMRCPRNSSPTTSPNCYCGLRSAQRSHGGIRGVEAHDARALGRAEVAVVDHDCASGEAGSSRKTGDRRYVARLLIERELDGLQQRQLLLADHGVEIPVAAPRAVLRLAGFAFSSAASSYLCSFESPIAHPEPVFAKKRRPPAAVVRTGRVEFMA